MTRKQVDELLAKPAKTITHKEIPLMTDKDTETTTVENIQADDNSKSMQGQTLKEVIRQNATEDDAPLS